MARWRKTVAVVPDEDMCYSCFATTKYSCIKCAYPVCNRCSVFEDDEETPGWVAGKSVGFCFACVNEGGHLHTKTTSSGLGETSSSGLGEATSSGLGETTSSGREETTSCGRGETTSCGWRKEINNNEKEKRESMGWWVVFLTVSAVEMICLNWFLYDAIQLITLEKWRAKIKSKMKDISSNCQCLSYKLSVEKGGGLLMDINIPLTMPRDFIDTKPVIYLV